MSILVSEMLGYRFWYLEKSGIGGGENLMFFLTI